MNVRWHHWHHKTSHVPFFFAVCTFNRLPVWILTSDLHSRIPRKTIHQIRAYDFGVQFSFKNKRLCEPVRLWIHVNYGNARYGFCKGFDRLPRCATFAFQKKTSITGKSVHCPHDKVPILAKPNFEPVSQPHCSRGIIYSEKKLARHCWNGLLGSLSDSIGTKAEAWRRENVHCNQPLARSRLNVLALRRDQK